MSASLFMKVSFSPDIIHSGWLGSKHQLTNKQTNLYNPAESAVRVPPIETADALSAGFIPFQTDELEM